ncbi:MAG: SCO family protein [Bacteroidetes bacterium]|nr:MAG: SCO family protein [Bacteroidota bacterium]
MKCEGEKTYQQKGTCPVCSMDLKNINATIETINADENYISEESIFNLTSKWNTQNNKTIELKELKGDVLVMVMIYTTCKSACPRLVADIRNIHDKVNSSAVKYVFVSIDPDTDTPERLKEYAIENKMDNDQWVFLQGTVEDVREFSNVLAVKYKQISPILFSHSNIISVFDEQGVLYYQQEGLGVDNDVITSKITELVE